MKQELDAKQKQLRELRDSKTNIFKRFGQHVPSFLEAVETAYRQGHFKRKPVGPLGKNNSLKIQFLEYFFTGLLEWLLLSTMNF